MNLKRWAFIGILFWAGNSLMAQEIDSSFSKQWIEIDSLLGISHLPESALDKVNQIYKLAEKNITMYKRSKPCFIEQPLK